jgi:hypothetical protein
MTDGEKEVWLQHCCMHIAHRTHDPQVLSRTLRLPFPVAKQVLAPDDAHELIRLASNVRLDVVVLTPHSVRWDEGYHISDQTTWQEEMASPRHGHNDGVFVQQDDGTRHEWSHALKGATASDNAQCK